MSKIMLYSMYMVSDRPRNEANFFPLIFFTRKTKPFFTKLVAVTTIFKLRLINAQLMIRNEILISQIKKSSQKSQLYGQ